MRIVDELKNIDNKRIIMRADFNVPIKEGKVVDEMRIKAAFKTIDYLKEAKARIILISHIENDEGASLKPVYDVLSKVYQLNFVESVDLSVIKSTIDKMNAGEIILLENIRKHKGETENDPAFVETLSSFADYYVNEAFPVSHRKHASIIGLPKYLEGYAGFRFAKEVAELSKVFNPPHPFLFILGGAKFETKEPLIRKFLKIADYVFVGGALGNDFFKARGFEVGGSMTSGSLPPEDILNNEKVLTPLDVIVRASDGRKVVRKPNEIRIQEIVSDAGPDTLDMLREKIALSHMVLWNGPLGFYERGFDQGTKELAQILSESRARSIVGGGDTTAAIESLGVEERLTFVSTGGGAMLDFLANGTLPGIEALK